MRVVSNAALDLGRQRGRRETVSLDAGPGRDAVHAQLLTTEPTAPGLEQAELRQMLDQALGTLSDVQRQTFVLYADAGLSYREVAEVMGTSIGTVMSRLFYARQKLRVFLSERIPS
jgi:RNA polymerase sigma-70 factor (ECF subfamily)